MNLAEKKAKIEKLRIQIAGCQRCPLHKTRTHTVPGEGSLEAPIMFIGEAPGQQEDLKGEPFVGRAGEILDQLLASIHLTRQEIYICNILKCRPPNNRNPLPYEISACVGSLDIQVKTINPAIMATLGNFATTYIFQKYGLPPARISQVAGKTFEVNVNDNTKIIVPLFHPAVATYDAGKLGRLLNDFKIIQSLLTKTPKTTVQSL